MLLEQRGLLKRTKPDIERKRYERRELSRRHHAGHLHDALFEALQILAQQPFGLCFRDRHAHLDVRPGRAIADRRHASGAAIRLQPQALAALDQCQPLRADPSLYHAHPLVNPRHRADCLDKCFILRRPPPHPRPPSRERCGQRSPLSGPRCAVAPFPPREPFAAPPAWR